MTKEERAAKRAARKEAKKANQAYLQNLKLSFPEVTPSC